MRFLIDDLRYAFRALRNSPGFTVVALLTLALGIGANTAVFSLVSAAMLRPLPVKDPQQLAMVTFAKGETSFGLSEVLLDAIERRQNVLSAMFGWRSAALTMQEGSESRLVEAGIVSANTFDVLGIKPILGRALTPADDHEGGGPAGWVALISYSFWQTHFQADPQIIGRKLEIEGTAFTIVGVAPPDFGGVDIQSRADVIVPMQFNRVLMGKPQVAFLYLTVIGRLKPGVTLAQAKAQIEAIGPAVIAENDTMFLLRRGFFGGARITVQDGSHGRSTIASALRDPLRVLEMLVGIVLLICGANVAGLFTARMAARRHDLAVRSALGARRSRLLLQFVAEALVLCAAGSLAAILIAVWCTPLLLHALMPKISSTPGQNYLVMNLSPDWHVFTFTLIIALGSAAIIALLPGLRASRVDVARDLSSATHQHSGHNARLESWIVTGQVAFASVLLVAAGLFAGTVYRLLKIDPGFQTHGVLLVPTDFHRRHEKPEQLTALYERMLERLRSMPGVGKASVEAIPMLGDWNSSTYYARQMPDGSIRSLDPLFYNEVGADYFSTAGTRVLAGRDFNANDRDPHHQVCVLNQSAAKFYFPEGNALGSMLREYGNKKLGDPCQIVGVVQDTKYTSLRTGVPSTIYWPYMQGMSTGMSDGKLYFVIRSGDLSIAAASARQVLRDFAPESPLLPPISMEEERMTSIGRERSFALLGSAFAALALLLTAIGLFGTLSYQVSRRTREIAIRIAVGADASSILRIVIGRAILLTVIGLAIGFCGAAYLGKLTASLLFGVKPIEPLALAAAAALLLMVSVAASFLPARRATKVDPMLALRAE